MAIFDTAIIKVVFNTFYIFLIKVAEKDFVAVDERVQQKALKSFYDRCFL